jgi:hypothetical protein
MFERLRCGIISEQVKAPYAIWLDDAAPRRISVEVMENGLNLFFMCIGAGSPNERAEDLLKKISAFQNRRPQAGTYGLR